MAVFITILVFSFVGGLIWEMVSPTPKEDAEAYRSLSTIKKVKSFATTYIKSAINCLGFLLVLGVAAFWLYGKIT